MLFAALFLASCTKDTASDPNGLSPELREVNTLIASAGELQTEKEKNDVIPVKTDTLPGIISDYYEPYIDVIYSVRCVEKTTRYDLVSNPSEFVTLDRWSNIWPGALIEGASLAKGAPVVIPIYEKRKPGRISLSMVSGSENMDEWYREVPMQDADVIQAQNELMNDYLGNSLPVRTSVEIKTVQSVEEMAVKLGINLNLYGARLAQTFGQNWNKEKSYVAVKLDQTFFTVGYDAPEGGFQGAFTDDIRVNDLQPYTGRGNPICYVGSVSYGRSFILLYESDSSFQELEVAISLIYRKYANASIWYKYKNILNQSICKMVQIGGNPKEGLATVFGDFDKLKTFLNNATVSKDNVGAPLSYVIYHLKDNSVARLSNMLKYEVTTKTYYPVLSRSNIRVDILSLQATRPKPRDKAYKVSCFSSVKIKSIKLKILDKDGDVIRGLLLDQNPEDMEKRGNEYGTNIFLSGFGHYPIVANDRRFRLECLVEVYNSIYHGGRKEDTREVLLTRTYECSPEGQWRAVSDGASSAADTFTSIKRTEIIADAEVNLDLKIRFVYDGMVLE